MGYLVFKRTKSQTIHIGDSITIIIADGQAKVGVDAPPNVPVHRGEVYARIQEAKRNDDQSTA